MRACELLEPDYLVHILKAVKHLSMNPSMLEVLQNANAIEILVNILDEHSAGPHSTVRQSVVPGRSIWVLIECCVAGNGESHFPNVL